MGMQGLRMPRVFFRDSYRLKTPTLNRAPSSSITINHHQSSGINKTHTHQEYTSTPLKIRHDNGPNQTWVKMWHVLLLMDQMIFQLAMWVSWGMHPGEYGELVDWLPGTPLLRAAGAGRFGAFKRLLEAQVPTLVVTKRGMFKHRKRFAILGINGRSYLFFVFCCGWIFGALFFC